MKHWTKVFFHIIWIINALFIALVIYELITDYPGTAGIYVCCRGDG